MLHPLLGQQPAFDVTSVKPSNSGTQNTNFGLAGGRFTATNAPLREIVRTAYEIPDQLIVNAPAWTKSARYDIAATMAGPNAPLKDVFAMVRALLADRFKLAAHMETREIGVYALRLASQNGRLGPRNSSRPPTAQPLSRPPAAVRHPRRALVSSVATAGTAGTSRSAARPWTASRQCSGQSLAVSS